MATQPGTPAKGPLASIIKACQRANPCFELDVDVLAVVRAAAASTAADWGTGTLTGVTADPASGAVRLNLTTAVSIFSQTNTASVVHGFHDGSNGSEEYALDFFPDANLTQGVSIELDSIDLYLATLGAGGGAITFDKTGIFRVRVCYYDVDWNLVPMGDPFDVKASLIAATGGIYKIDFVAAAQRRIIFEPGQQNTNTGPGFDGTSIRTLNPDLKGVSHIPNVARGLSISVEPMGRNFQGAWIGLVPNATAAAFDPTTFWRHASNREMGPYNPQKPPYAPNDTGHNPQDRLITGAAPGYGAKSVTNGLWGVARRPTTAQRSQSGTWEQPYHVLRAKAYVSTGTLVNVLDMGAVPTNDVQVKLDDQQQKGTSLAYTMAGSNTASTGPWTNVGEINQLLRSEEFDNASWTKGGVTITANAALAPDGTMTADLMKEDASTGDHRCYQGTVPVNGQGYGFAVRAKAAGRSLLMLTSVTGGPGGLNNGVVFDLINGVVTSGIGGMTPLGDGWFLCYSGIVGNGVGTNWQIRLVQSGITTSYTGDNASGVYLWGADLKANKYANPAYNIATEGDSITTGNGVATPWPTLLGMPLYATLVNHAVGGTTTNDMRTRFDSYKLGGQTHFWGLMGINDIRLDVPLATTQANLTYMWSTAQSLGMSIIIFTTTPWHGDAYGYWTPTRAANQVVLNDWIRQQARDNGYTLLDTYPLLNDPANDSYLLPAYDSGDGIHLSQAGQQVLANAVRALGLPVGFTPTPYVHTTSAVLGGVVDGQILTGSDKYRWYQLTATFTPGPTGATKFASPVLQAWQMVERLPLQTWRRLKDFDSIETCDPVTGQTSIGELKLPILKAGRRDYRDLASQLGSAYAPSQIEAHVYMRNTRDGTRVFKNSYRLENREPMDGSEQMTFVTGLDRLTVQIPAAVEIFRDPPATGQRTATSVTNVGTTYTVNVSGTPYTASALNGFRMHGVTGQCAGVDYVINSGNGTGSFTVTVTNQTPPLTGDTFEIHSDTTTRSGGSYVGQDFSAIYSDLLAVQAAVPARYRGAIPATTGRTGTATLPSDGVKAIDVLQDVALHADGIVTWEKGRITFKDIYSLNKVSVATWDDRQIVSLTTPVGADRRMPSVRVKYGYQIENSKFANQATYEAFDELTGWGRPNLFDVFEFPDNFCKWNDVNEAKYSADKFQRAWKSGVRLWNVRTVLMWPWLELGDAVTILTDQYADRRLSFSADGLTDNGVPLVGPLSAVGVIVGKNLWGTDFVVAIRGLDAISGASQTTGTQAVPSGKPIRATAFDDGKYALRATDATGATSVSDAFNNQGSFLPAPTAKNLFSYNSAGPANGRMSMSFSWSAFSYYRPDGSSVGIGASSALATPPSPSLSTVVLGSLGARTVYVRIGYIKNNMIYRVGPEASIACPANSVIKVTSPTAVAGYDRWVPLVGLAANGEYIQTTFNFGSDYTEASVGFNATTTTPYDNTNMPNGITSYGLQAGSTYYFYPFVDIGTGLVVYANEGSLTQSEVWAAAQNSDGRVPIAPGGMTAVSASAGSTSTGSTGGGRFL